MHLLKIKIFGAALLLFAIGFGCLSCEKDDDVAAEPMLIVKFKFDGNQSRLNNLGQPADIPAGNAAQTPDFNFISAHYMEFSSSAKTQLGDGTILYHGAETTVGGKNAIDFNQAKIVNEGEVFLEIPLSKIANGSYEWVRVSLAYQNYRINVRNAGQDYSGTLASFVGFNNYISSFDIDNAIFNINGNRAQGYWAFKLDDNPYSTEGQAPEGATTVPNPIAATSPVTPGSCVVTGKFAKKLNITGKETQNILVTLSLSVNKSFEWREVVVDGKYEPSKGENVVDMGLRGLMPTFQTSYKTD